MRILPLHDQVVIALDPAPKTSAGGIHLPDSAKADRDRGAIAGSVVAVGRGRRADSGVFVETSVTAGDRVLIAKYAGTGIELDGKLHTVVPESELLGILVDDAG